MSDTVQKLIEKTREVHQVDGMEFLCRRWNAALGLEAFGAGAFAIVQDGDQQRVELKKDAIKSRLEMIEKVLKVAMISPALGAEDDPDADTVSMRTLSVYATELFNCILGRDAAQAGNFPESSPGSEV